MVGMLIAPGIAARQWTNQLGQMVILAAIFGAFAGGTGAILSAVDKDLPTGPMIIVVSFVLVLLSIALAPGRGLVWKWVRLRRDRQQFAAQTVLRELFHYAYDHGSLMTPVPEKFILGVGGPAAALGLRRLREQGLVQPEGAKWQLTPEGIKAASHTVQNVLLWDIYRQFGDELGLPLVAEDRQQDIRHLLSAEAVARLEEKLAGRLG